MKNLSLLTCLLGVWLLTACASSGTRATGGSPTGSPTGGPAGYTLAGGGPCVRLGTKPQAPFTNIPVGHDTYPAHSEPMLAENPHNPLQLVGGSKFFSDPAHYAFQIGTYASADGGCTWTTGALLPGIAPGLLTSDPSFAFDSHGTVYASVLYRERGVVVFASTDGGKTFEPPVYAFPVLAQGIVDKPWIGVDPQSGAISIVMSYTKPSCGNTGASVCGEIAYVRSTDGGKTFTAPRFIEGASSICSNQSISGLPAGVTHQCFFGTGATPVIGQDGNIAVVYLYINPDTNATYQLLVTSHDSGQTWSNPVTVATVHDLPTTFAGEKYRVTPLPAFCGDPQTGRLYLAWADAQGKHANIMLTTSADFGKSWSQAVRANDNSSATAVNDSQPQLACAPNGVISLSFFDTRNDPQGHLLDVYLTQSVDQGASWQANVRVTTKSWNPDVGAPLDADGVEFIGDYQGLTADNLFVHPFWNDTRTGQQMIVTAAIPSALPPTK